MELSVAVPASCGELVQGYLHGAPFLVTLPIHRYAVATVRDDGRGERPTGWKSREALRHILSYYKVANFPYSLTVASSIPRGKGMASSSADMGAVLYAAATALEKELTAQEAAYIAASIEPTDGVFCPGLCCLNYEIGQIHRVYDYALPLVIVMIDTGGNIDTLQFHASHPDERGELSPAVQALLHEPWSYECIGAAATASAFANQQILPKPRLDELYTEMMSRGALGINVAHSGTMIGILFRLEREDAYYAQSVCAGLEQIQYEGTYYDTVHVVSGGYRASYR